MKKILVTTDYSTSSKTGKRASEKAWALCSRGAHAPEEQPHHYRCVIVEDLSPNKAVLEYAKLGRSDYICISTRGVGSFLKIIGTNTSKIMETSPVPELVVPHTYRTNSVQKLMYSSDLENLKHSPNLYLCPSYKAYFRLTSNSRVGVLFLKRLLPAEVIQLHFSKGHFEITFPLELPTAILLELGIESYMIHSECYPIR